MHVSWRCVTDVNGDVGKLGPDRTVVMGNFIDPYDVDRTRDVLHAIESGDYIVLAGPSEYRVMFDKTFGVSFKRSKFFRSIFLPFMYKYCDIACRIDDVLMSYGTMEAGQEKNVNERWKASIKTGIAREFAESTGPIFSAKSTNNTFGWEMHEIPYFADQGIHRFVECGPGATKLDATVLSIQVMRQDGAYVFQNNTGHVTAWFLRELPPIQFEHEKSGEMVLSHSWKVKGADKV